MQVNLISLKRTIGQKDCLAQSLIAIIKKSPDIIEWLNYWVAKLLSWSLLSHNEIVKLSTSYDCLKVKQYYNIISFTKRGCCLNLCDTFLSLGIKRWVLNPDFLSISKMPQAFSNYTFLGSLLLGRTACLEWRATNRWLIGSFK